MSIPETKAAGRCPAGMVYIPASQFWMGVGKWDEKKYDTPRHPLNISTFCIDEHEVTNGEYDKFLPYKLVSTDCDLKKSVVAEGNDTLKLYADYVDKGGKPGKCGLAAESKEDDYVGGNARGSISVKLGQPAVNVSWKAAKEHCASLKKRLPTEAEWEKAAVGPSGGFDLAVEYATKSGKLSAEEAVYDAKGPEKVCSKPRNGYGLCDMTGNVSEWVNDWYGAAYYINSSLNDPTGPESAVEYMEFKVIRGGSWSDKPSDERDPLRVTSRNSSYKPDVAVEFAGFRCAADPLPKGE